MEGSSFGIGVFSCIYKLEYWNFETNRKTAEMKLFLGLFLIVVLTYVDSSDINSEWAAYKEKYNKYYDSPELENFRRSVFEKEFDKVERQNTKFNQGFTKVKLTINENSDMTASEKRCKKYNPYLLFPGCTPIRF